MQRNVVLEHVRKLDSGAGLFRDFPFFGSRAFVQNNKRDRNKTQIKDKNAQDDFKHRYF